MDAQELPRLSRADLTRLTTTRILPNLTKIPLFLGLMVVAGVLTWTTDSAIVEWTMYVVLGYLWMSIVTFMHDATHHTLFRRRWLNPAFGIVAMIPVGVSFVAFRKDHLEHHRHNRSPRDPDAFTMGRRGVADMVLFYAYMVAGALLSFLHFNVLYPIKSFDRREWAMHLFETALKVAAGVGAGVLGARSRHAGQDAGALADPDLHLFAVQFRSLHRRALQHALGSGPAPRHAHDQLESSCTRSSGTTSTGTSGTTSIPGCRGTTWSSCISC